MCGTWVIKALASGVVVCTALLAFPGCTEPEDYLNPFDPANPLTAGSPPAVAAAPGSQRATLSWIGLGAGGIRGYRVYRRFDGDATPKFEAVLLADGTPAEVLSVTDSKTGREIPGHRYVFVDDGAGQGLLNDQTAPSGIPIPYVYRLSVVDVNGVETPDPNAPPDLVIDGLRWPSVNVTPSDPPPPPIVEVAADDLRVLLSWDAYVPPADAFTYRVYGAFPVAGQTPELDLLAEIPVETPLIGDIGGGGVDTVRRYLDKTFTRDGQMREYVVTVVDIFKVESEDRPDLRRRVTVPNLPPGPVRIVDITTATEDTVFLSWTQSQARDLQGYNIYVDDLSHPSGWRLIKTVKTKTETRAEIRSALLFLRTRFVTAFDDTAREDGNFDQIYPEGYIFDVFNGI